MTPSEFKTQFPEFAAETDERVQLFIDRAAPHFDVERWGDLYPDGVAYHVAHELADGGCDATVLTDREETGYCV